MKETHEDWGQGAEDFDGNHKAARRIAAESLVLLKNDAVLPFTKDKKLLVVGEYAEIPHFQGGGSSQVNVFQVDEGIQILQEEGFVITYVKDFADTDSILSAAKECDVALVYIGSPVAGDSEGFDRENMDLPFVQNEAICLLSETALPIVTVLYEASAVTMPWAKDVEAILAAFLPGEGGSGAVVDVLTGKVNPSGKLPETFAKRLQDTPAYLYFPGEGDESLYTEGLFVGYRYFERKEIEPLFAFGHGLSYTSFRYDNLTLIEDKKEFLDTDTVTFTVDVTNTAP